MLKSNNRDRLLTGLLVGLPVPIAGVLIYGLYWAFKFDRSFPYFWYEIFLGVPTHRSAILAIGLLLNLVPFLFFIRRDRYKAARGVMLAVFIYAPFVVYFRFVG